MKTMNNYTVLHCHTQLSNATTTIDSITDVDDYIKRAVECNMKALCISEHGNFLSWIRRKEHIEAAGLKYIHGVEAYLTKSLDEKIRDNYHCLLIAKNYDGVRELNKLISNAYNRLDGHFYFVPRLTLKELYSTSNNIICTSACLGGALRSQDPEVVGSFVNFMSSHKDRCYLEIQPHLVQKQYDYNQWLYRLHMKTGIPMVACTDTHSLNNEHAKGRLILQKAKNISFPDEDNWTLTWFTYDELVEQFEKQGAINMSVVKSAIENTNVIADMVEPFELDRSKKYPGLYKDPMSTLKKKIIEGIKRRGIDNYPNFDEYKRRIAYELKTYEYNGAIDFILLEEDYKSALKKDGINFGYSRGSVSGSIICYILGITEVDSIKFGLSFERFMNTERISLADVDTDWFDEDRDKVRQYLTKKDGLFTSDIVTFNTIKTKGAIKDVGRALGMKPDQTQALSDAVEKDEKGKDVIPDRIKKQYPELCEYVDLVSGTTVSIGSHPAGLIVAPHDIATEYGTITTATDPYPVSAINMKEVDSLNLVKLDVLGLDAVGLIDKTCKLVGIPFLTPDTLNFGDMAVWNDIKEDCTTIFQFESEFAGKYLQTVLSDKTIKKIKKRNPNFSYIDLMSMANGAIRPAGESYREQLAAGEFKDNGNDELNAYLASTQGFLVYQEQVIGFLNKFCGYTMGEADVIRRGFAKKVGTNEYIPEIKRRFVDTMVSQHGITSEEAEEIVVDFLQVIQDASNYLFSKNHADPYSHIGFCLAYLRHYYTLEYLTVAMNIYRTDEKKSLEIKRYAKKKGVAIHGIKFGKSKAEYFMDKETNGIYQGLESIKYCNAQIAEEMWALKDNSYPHFAHLLKDIDNKTSVDSRQREIITRLDFFSAWGKNAKLLKIIILYDNIAHRKTLKKSDLEKFGIPEYIAEKYSETITEKQYKDIDNIGMIVELSEQIEDKSIPIKEQIITEVETLGGAVYTNPTISPLYYIVIDYKTYGSNTARPYVTVRNLHDGEEIKTKVTSGKLYQSSPFGLWSILSISSFTEKPKMRKINDEWVATDEMEKIISEYETIVR